MIKIFTFNASVLEDEALFEKYLKKVSPYRLEKIRSLKFKRDKMLSLAASIAIDKGLNEYSLFEKDMTYEKNKYGKPYFAPFPDIHFSLSHSGTMAIAAFSDREVGCDIEKLRSVDLKIAERFFCPEEKQYINSHTDPCFAFLRLWTLKESFLKALGLGLSRPLDSFCINISGDKAENLKTEDGHEYSFFEQTLDDHRIAACEIIT